MIDTAETTKKTVAVCDTQPVTAEGLKVLIGADAGLEFGRMVATLEAASELVRNSPPDLLIIDKGFGMHAVLDWLHDLKVVDTAPATIVWGVSMTEAEALRLLQAGAKGIIRKCADLNSLLTCLHTVSEGHCWMEECVFHESLGAERGARSDLTAREVQVLELVEQGFKNKEIAVELGIRPGTVKIHLKHIFEKTGVRGRYGLAITGLKEKGLVSMA